MKKIARSIMDLIRKDLKEKMVFISGPRQVGKTSLAKEVIAAEGGGVYLNWDSDADRRVILAAKWPEAHRLIVLDEIHKYLRWKRFVKGEFDTKKERHSFLVTGSARLDIYRKGGDSLQGRYHSHRLHPITLAEANHRYAIPEPFSKLKMSGELQGLERLLVHGGFPEPFARADARFTRRWRQERRTRILREDVRDLSRIQDIFALERLMMMLPARVGSPLSINSLREDLEVSFRTVKGWLNLLEALFLCYRIPPWHHNIARALKQENKLYLWDWAEAAETGPRFENMIASHLLKLCHALTDAEGYDARLWYVRDKEKREVDFLVTVDGKPWFIAEAKVSDERKGSLGYFSERLKVPIAYLVSKDCGDAYESQGVVHANASVFLTALGV
ncbi:MAG: ATP-binding protein [Fibrobacterota bacterium]